MRKVAPAAAILGCLWLTACLGFVYDETLDGPFRIVAVDTYEDMALCRTVNHNSDCIGDGLAGGPTIFMVGWDANYIVAARHPRSRSENHANRSITEFYYIVRAASDVDALKSVKQVGPLNHEELAANKVRLNLPEFTRVFKSLK